MAVASDPISVLCVDDEPGFADLTATLLAEHDDRLETVATTDGRDALDRIEERSFDCIVSDHDMPGMDGLALLDAVRDDDPDIPFVLYTGKGSEEIASAAITAGVTDYLRKETGTGQYAVLARRVSHAVERRRALAAVEADNGRGTTGTEGGSRYRAAFQEAFDALVVSDGEGRYVDANDSACRLFGLPRAELIGRQISEFAPEEYDFEDAWETFLDSDDQRGTFPLVRADGQRRTVEYAATADIVPGEHLSIMRDVTERERQYETIQTQKAELERFAGIVSHDLRTPLATARGYLELAREDGEPEQFDRIDRALARMDRIVDDVLWLARRGRAIGETEPVDLRRAIADAWLIVADDSTAAELHLPDGPLGEIESDSDRLSQLLENLLRNAVEHGGTDVEIYAESTETGFAVEDTGPGVPESRRELVFDHGYTTRPEGTGLGLAIVQSIAEAHGWTVSVTTGKRGGARFEISAGGTPGD